MFGIKCLGILLPFLKKFSNYFPLISLKCSYVVFERSAEIEYPNGILDWPSIFSFPLDSILCIRSAKSSETDQTANWV